MLKKIKLMFIMWKTKECRHNCFMCKYVDGCVDEIIGGD